MGATLKEMKSLGPAAAGAVTDRAFAVSVIGPIPPAAVIAQALPHRVRAAIAFAGRQENSGRAPTFAAAHGVRGSGWRLHGGAGDGQCFGSGSAMGSLARPSTRRAPR
jgi:hypothetical protein